MLNLVGLGLWDEKDITLRGIEACKNSDIVYAEFYTNIWKGNLKRLEKTIGKKIQALKRSDLEENSEKTISQAKNKDVSILICGDPLVFTTHANLIAEARKKKIKTNIIHNASIFSAIGETGLHVYKFGRPVTIPLSDKTKIPESVYDVIKENKKAGLHTLLLLDMDAEKKKFLTPNEAMEVLLEIGKEKIVTEKTDVIVFSSAGSPKPDIKFGKIENLINKKFSLPAIIIIPAKLHFSEKEFLNSF